MYVKKSETLELSFITLCLVLSIDYIEKSLFLEILLRFTYASL